MNNDLFLSIAISPPALALYAVICVVALLAYRVLSRQWTRPGVSRSARSRDITALGVITLTSLALVAYGDSYLRAQATAETLDMEQLQEKTELAAKLHTRIAGELDAARTLLADRTLTRIVNLELIQARAELGRFASFQDPKINRMIELIDIELEIRKLVRQTFTETDPQALAKIYGRLTVLAPGNDEYREKAALDAGSATAAAAQPQSAAPGPVTKP